MYRKGTLAVLLPAFNMVPSRELLALWVMISPSCLSLGSLYAFCIPQRCLAQGRYLVNNLGSIQYISMIESGLSDRKKKSPNQTVLNKTRDIRAIRLVSLRINGFRNSLPQGLPWCQQGLISPNLISGSLHINLILKSIGDKAPSAVLPPPKSEFKREGGGPFLAEVPLYPIGSNWAKCPSLNQSLWPGEYVF